MADLQSLFALFTNDPKPAKPEKEKKEKGSSGDNGQKRYWDDAEHLKYLEAVFMFGKADILKISSAIKTRTPE